MSLMTEDKYIESLRNMHTRVFMFGEQIHNFVDHPIIRPSIHSVARTYRWAQDPDYSALMTVISPYTNEVINRFTHIHQSTQDLMNKVRMQRVMGQKTAACFQRCVGMDAINAVYSTTYEIDQKYGTDYFQRFKKYLMYIQKNDLMIDGAMTDPKGDRGKAPSEQSDPDMYLHIVSRSERGIVINGAKAHQTGAVNSHEILIMPTKNPYYKKISNSVTEEDRVAMVELAIEDNVHFQLSKEELNREGTTYTVETLSHLRVKHPGYEYYFIMGADSLYHIESWKDPEKILEMATIVVAGRAGTGTSLSSQIEYIENKYDATIYRLNSPVLEISSNDIRRRVRDGESIRYLLPSKVVDYIYGHNLYQPDPPEEVQKENE